jgi:membrane protein YdbS with pleckstrin-like domain
MKTYKPAVPRGVSSCLAAFVSISLMGAVLVGLLRLAFWLDVVEHRRPGLPVEVQDLLLACVVCGLAALAVCWAVSGLLVPLHTRYEVGATELTTHRGLFWRRSSAVDLAAITRIDVVSGPLSRLFGLSDLQVFTLNSRPSPSGQHEVASATLIGLRDAEDVRRILLERRESLHEAAVNGDYSPARTPQDLLLQRLATSIERLLPGSSRL